MKYTNKNYPVSLATAPPKKVLCWLWLLVFLWSNNSLADCGCDYVVPAGQHVTDGAVLGIQPGDVICLQAGISYKNLKFTNLQGTANNPIIIRNCGGQVIIDLSTGFSFAMKTEHSRHFRITGSGDNRYEYGIVLRGAHLGLVLDILSTDFEIDHMELASAGFAGIMAKTDPRCGKPYGRDEFTMTNINIHDNYVHDTGGEGLYIGNSRYAKGISTSCGTLFPHAIHNAKIHHNIVKRTGWDGIQVGAVTQGCAVYNNVVEDYGVTSGNATHGNGIQLGEGTGGGCYNNSIREGNGYGSGIIALGWGDNVIFNNLIVNPGRLGSFIDSRPPASPGDGFKFINNTIIGPVENGVRIYAREENLRNMVKNNLIVDATLPVKLYNSSVTNVEVANNFSPGNVSEAGFVDASGGDYQLTASSPAVDAGSDVSQYGITDDYEGTTRPIGPAYDIGAYEYEYTLTTEDIWLEAECGTVGNHWETLENAEASEGKYVVYPQGLSKELPPSDPADQIVYSFDVSQAGSYYLLARIKASNISKNSFWVRIDNQPWIEWWEGMALSQQFNWNQAPGAPFVLSAGNHTITFAYREDGTQLDKLLISSSDVLPIGTGEATSNCNSQPPPSSVVKANAGPDRTVSVNVSQPYQILGGAKGPNPFRRFLWEKVSGPSLTLNGNSANAKLSNLQVGTYVLRFTATDSEGNSGSDEMTLTVTGSNARLANGTKKVAETAPNLPSDTQIQIYPNPADDYLQLNVGQAWQGSLSLTDLTGHQIYQRSVFLSGSNVTVPTANLPEGLYLLRIRQKDRLQFAKVLIEH